MSDPIFVPEPMPEPERPVDYVANPLRVQRPSPTQQDPRPYVRLDLVALATSIIASETECRELRGKVAELTHAVNRLEARLDQVERERRSGKLARALAAFERVMSGDDEDEDDEPDPSDSYDRRGW